MGVSVFPAASGGASVSDGNSDGWNLGANQVELISEYTTTTLMNTITISSIPQTYRNLIIQWNGIETLGVGSHNVRLRMNNHTTGHAEFGWYFNNGFNPSTINHPNNDGWFVGQVPNVTGGQTLNGRILIENYSSTVTKIANGTATYYSGSDYTKVWDNLSYRQSGGTPAITSITFIAGAGNTLGMSGATSAGIRLYGVK